MNHVGDCLSAEELILVDYNAGKTTLTTLV